MMEREKKGWGPELTHPRPASPAGRRGTACCRARRVRSSGFFAGRRCS